MAVSEGDLREVVRHLAPGIDLVLAVSGPAFEVALHPDAEAGPIDLRNETPASESVVFVKTILDADRKILPQVAERLSTVLPDRVCELLSAGFKHIDGGVSLGRRRVRGYPLISDNVVLPPLAARRDVHCELVVDSSSEFAGAFFIAFLSRRQSLALLLVLLERKRLSFSFLLPSALGLSLKGSLLLCEPFHFRPVLLLGAASLRDRVVTAPVEECVKSGSLLAGVGRCGERRRA